MTSTGSSALAGPSTTRPARLSTKLRELLGLPQPGGPSVEAEARARAIQPALPFPARCWTGPIATCRSRASRPPCCAPATRIIADRGGLPAQDRADLCAGFQAAVADVLAEKSHRALIAYLARRPPRRCSPSPAVSPPTRRSARRWNGAATEAGAGFVAPPLALCTDNAAMIAWAGLELFRQGHRDDLDPCGATALAARPVATRHAGRRQAWGEGMSVAVLGAGAFGTALAIAIARGQGKVTLWARDADHVAAMRHEGENRARLPGAALPPNVTVTGDLAAAARAQTVLLAIPMQALAPFLKTNRERLAGKSLVACCKGIDLASGRTAADVIGNAVPDATALLLSGPSFAVDIAAGLPTALTLAAGDAATAQDVQAQLSTTTLRLYTSTDLVGVALGGALKNVVAIACGIAIGAGLGESARAALMTRGYAEMQRFALAHGALPDTLSGLSGLGDLALTCHSEKSRNYAYGLQLGRDGRATATATTEGIATARAVADLARGQGIEMPVTTMIAAVLNGDVTVDEATRALLARPLRPE